MAKAKPKKWASLKDKYPAAAPGANLDGDWFENHVKPLLRKHDGKNLRELSELLMQHKARKAEREKRISEEDNAAIKALELLILKALEGQGVESFRDPAGRLFNSKPEPSFKILDPVAVDKWIDEQGYSDLRKVDTNTLKALFRKALEAGTDIPEGVDVSVMTLLTSPRPEGAADEKE
jgi:hypothetical protein